jgi:tryptophan-rich sensory protein
MSELASASQLRAAFIRWALVLVPGTLLLGFLSGQVAGSGAGNPWFDGLVKPAIYPPPATFGIVWSILYVLMAVSLVLVVTARGAPGRGLAIALWVLQFLVNLAWSPTFFGAHQISAALIVLAVLVGLVALATVLFLRVRTIAGLLMLPYLGWVLFAAVLNWQFLELNPNADGVNSVTRVEI